MQLSFRSFIDAPRVADAPERLPRDWVAVALLSPLPAVELAVRDDLAWPVVSAALGWMMLLMLPWRRTKAVYTTAAAFGSIVVMDVLLYTTSERSFSLYTSAIVLVMLFALFRWAAGREIALAFVVVLAALMAGTVTDYTGIADLVGGIVILGATAEAGLLVRGFVESRTQQINQAKMRERHELARELHDTVAHHVSAIAIQAQAGRFLAGQDSLSGAADALEVIEEEAARTLAEMRSMIETLRESDADVDMVPQQGISAIERLARDGDSPRVAVTMSGDLERLATQVEAAAFRIAQESVTNAIRHARHATLVDVQVHGDVEALHVTVVDNGEVVSSHANTSSGFGLIGMNERALLLGGTLQVGPAAERGWIVRAQLPRQGVAR